MYVGLYRNTQITSITIIITNIIIRQVKTEWILSLMCLVIIFFNSKISKLFFYMIYSSKIISILCWIHNWVFYFLERVSWFYLYGFCVSLPFMVYLLWGMSQRWCSDSLGNGFQCISEYNKRTNLNFLRIGSLTFLLWKIENKY